MSFIDTEVMRSSSTSENPHKRKSPPQTPVSQQAKVDTQQDQPCNKKAKVSSSVEHDNVSEENGQASQEDNPSSAANQASTDTDAVVVVDESDDDNDDEAGDDAEDEEASASEDDEEENDSDDEEYQESFEHCKDLLRQLNSAGDSNNWQEHGKVSELIDAIEIGKNSKTQRALEAARSIFDDEEEATIAKLDQDDPDWQNYKHMTDKSGVTLRV